MRARSHKKKCKRDVIVSAKSKGKVAVMTPPESKERDTQSLTKLIETGTSDPKTKSLIRLVGKSKQQKEQMKKPDKEKDIKNKIHPVEEFKKEEE